MPEFVAMEIRDVDGTTITIDRSRSDPSLISVEIIDARGQGGSAYLDPPAALKLMEAFQLAMGPAEERARRSPITINFPQPQCTVACRCGRRIAHDAPRVPWIGG